MRRRGKGAERAGFGSRFAGLSGRRRALLAAVACLVLAAGAATAVAAATSGSSNVAAGRTGPVQDRLGPVVLVPGYGGSTGSLDQLARRIRASGRPATVLRLPGSGTGSLLADATQLNGVVSDYLRHGASSVDVIGYSAGGVVALIWARLDHGAARARRIITLGSPFHGTQLAATAEAVAPGACPAACRQLVPGSTLLASLHVGDPTGLPAWISLWTSDDQTVTPPDSAELPGAINVPVQSVCPAARVSHSQLPTDPAVVDMILQELGRAPLARPAASACG